MIRHGDCLAVLPTLEAGSVDAIVTDPPYGLGFMGKAWDHGVPGVPFWEAAVRVAKPGAHLLAFGGTRTYHRLACAVEDAGWEIRDCLNWLYGSGFPKSHNGPWGGTALKPAWEPIVLARKPLVGTVAANVAAHGTGALNIDGCRIAGVKPATTRGASPGRAMASRLEGQGRIEDDGRGRWPANVALDPEAADMLDEQSGERQGASSNSSPSTDVGFTRGAGGIPLRPGYGDTGGASRFFFTAKDDPCEPVSIAAPSSGPSNRPGASAPRGVATEAHQEAMPPGPSLAGQPCMPDYGDSTPPRSRAQSAEALDSTDTIQTTPTYCESCGSALPVTAASINQGSAGAVEGASGQVSGTRFLYCPKASRAEREEGVEGETRRVGSLRLRTDAHSEATGNLTTPARNHHPTVKPVALMRWLCRLVTPPGGLILDPFAGSGTTGIAAALEGFRFLGVELNEEYAAIARARIAKAAEQPSLWSTQPPRPTDHGGEG